jgi:hypothetical protein
MSTISTRFSSALPMFASVLCIVITCEPVIAQAKAPVYAAEITDKGGTKMTIKEVSFGYDYSYRRANCSWACTATGRAKVPFVPLNDTCGVAMIPLTEIASIELSTKPADGAQHRGTVTFTDGRIIESKFGRFGGESIEAIEGVSAIGDYSLPIAKVARVVFQHAADSLAAESQWGSAKAAKTASFTCLNGMNQTLTKTGFYGVGDDGKVQSYEQSKVELRVGDSTISMDVSRLKSLVRASEPNKESKYTLTTIAGDAIETTLRDGTYLGGMRGTHFFYIPLSELRELQLSP